MKFINGTVFTDKFENTDVCVSDGVFSEGSCGEVIDVSGKYIIPGLIDIHTHGAVGTDVYDDELKFEEWRDYLYTYGVTTFFPTSASMQPEDLCRIYKKLGENDEIVGINLEGPFLNVNKRGAHIPETIRPASIAELEKLMEISKGKIKITTVAPEIEGNLEFIKQATEKFGITVSIGHSSADFETSQKAFANGATHVTHTFNAMNQMLHRDPGLIGAAILNKNVYCELICDGIHVDKAMVLILFNAIGEDRLILVSDSMAATGFPDGEYILSGIPVTVKDSIARTPDGALAGSTNNLMKMLRCAVKFGIPKESAIKAATINPARAVKIDDKYGSIEIGKNADFIICDEAFNVYSVYKNGVCVYTADN